MMAKGKDKQPVYVVRKGLSLVPQMEMDADVIKGIPENSPVSIDIKQPRFGPRHRAYWAMLNDCVKATGCAPNSSVLHAAVKLGTNHVDLVRLSGGLTVAVPGSIAFDKMTESEMVTFFDAATEYLAREHGFVGEDSGAKSSQAPDKAGGGSTSNLSTPALADGVSLAASSSQAPSASHEGAQ